MEYKELLLISADERFSCDLQANFSGVALQLIWARESQQGLKLAREGAFPLILLDARLPDLDADKLARRLLTRNPIVDLVVFVSSEAQSLRERFRQIGIEEICDPDSPLDEIVFRVRELLLQRQHLAEVGLVGKSPELKRIAETVIQVASSELTVLITGESGTGKELIAQALHRLSPRSTQPFLAVNCAAIAEGVLESELFGHEKGAFTGAVSQRQGLFELADGGTLLLDEIGEMKPATQVKLLRVLEEKKFRRVGGKQLIAVDVRVIGATNRDLVVDVASGDFRRDLFYRFSVVKIDVPPLRQRRSDIPLLLYHFVNQEVEKGGQRLEVTDEALRLLGEYHWPGNVRELRNFVESMQVLSGGKITGKEVTLYIESQHQLDRQLPVATGKSSEVVERELIYQALVSLGRQVAELRQLLLSRLPASLAGREVLPFDRTPSGAGPPRGGFLPLNPEQEIVPQISLEELERQTIERVLSQVHGNRKKAAQILGIGERTLYRKIDKYGLSQR